jgi:hypothetical protein
MHTFIGVHAACKDGAVVWKIRISVSLSKLRAVMASCLASLTVMEAKRLPSMHAKTLNKNSLRMKTLKRENTKQRLKRHL